MTAAQIAEKFIQDMVDNAARAGIEIIERPDGKIEFNKEWLYEHDSPWIHINHLKENRCLLWRDLIYNGISRKLKKKIQFVHTGCQNCYKVVVRPRTYEELLRLEDTMNSINLPSKIGIERRPFVNALYGAYFYNRGIENGLNRLEEVIDMVDRMEFDSSGTFISPMEVYLKRGCTEMEMEQGPSNKWRTTILQPEIEDIVDSMIHTPEQPDQTDEQKNEVRQSWEKWAWKFDKSYSGSIKQPFCMRY
jgi:hypothetical protein